MLAKVLPLLLLLWQLVHADDLPSEVPAHLKSHPRGELQKKLSHANLQSPLQSLLTISWNKPSLVTYRERKSRDPKIKGDAVIRQLDSNSDKKRECVVPAISHKYTELETYLYSMDDNKEILLITKRFDEKPPSTDIFVVDMNDCTYTTQILPIDFSDIPERGRGYIVLRPWKSDQFDIFTFGDKNECGTWVCRRVFDIKNNLIKKPAKFSWLNDGFPKAPPNWDLYDLLAIRDDRYIGVLTQSNTKARLDYLTERGADIKSIETFVNFFRDMKLQSSFSDIGMCYSMTHEVEQMNCMQIDAKEGMLKKYNFTQDLGFNPQAFAIRTLPDYGGIILFTMGCPAGSPRCQRYKLQLTQVSSEQTMTKLQAWDPDSRCDEKSEYDLTMYEDTGKICTYYSCKIPPQEGQPDRTLLAKCFDIPKPK